MRPTDLPAGESSDCTRVTVSDCACQDAKDCQISAGPVLCLHFGDIVPSHCLYRDLYFHERGCDAEGEHDEQAILGLRERGSSAVCGHDDAGYWRRGG
jgi:hypothetical protein